VLANSVQQGANATYMYHKGDTPDNPSDAAAQIFVVSKEKIQQEGYATLYSYMTRNKNGAVAKLVFSVPKPYQVQRALCP